MASTATERRQNPRVPWTGSASAEGVGGHFEGHGIDVSAGGAAFRSSEPAMLGDLMSLRLSLDGTVITMHGFVVASVERGEWHRHSVRFTAGPPVCHEALEGFVRRRLAPPPKSKKIPPPPPIPKFAGRRR